jgi:small subunit ribosomal protein S8
MDTVGNFLTVIRNASSAHKETCVIQWSKLKEGIAKILKANGYIADYQVIEESDGKKRLVVAIKFVEGVPAITSIQRKSKPGCREYAGYEEIPPVLRGLGISILSTSKGVLSDREAKQQKVGGELLCQIY